MVISSLKYGVEKEVLGKIKGKCCPKCGGMMSLEFYQEEGYFKSCLNCGCVDYLVNSFLQGHTENTERNKNEGRHLNKPVLLSRREIR